MNSRVTVNASLRNHDDVVITKVTNALLQVPSRRCGSKSGFSLMELLAVVAVISIIVSISVMSLAGLYESTQINEAISKTESALKRARAHAIANQTYAWVGFFEKNPNDASQPAVSGKGEVLISIVASTNGSSIYSKPANNSSRALDQNPIDLEQVAPLISLSNVDLVNIPQTELARDEAAPDEFQVGDDEFSLRPYYFGSSSKTKNSITFNYPPGTSSTTQATFIRSIEFAPNGDASKTGTETTRLLEIGLRPTKGSQDLPDAANIAVIQVRGITGSIRLLRK